MRSTKFPQLARSADGSPASWLQSGTRRVVSISAALVGTTAVTSILGLGYWTIAARQSSVASLGVAGAAVALMQLLGTFGMLGLGTLLIAEIPRTNGHRRIVLVRTALVVSGLASTGLGAVAGLVIAATGAGGLRVMGSPLNVLDLALGTGLTGVTMVLDQAMLVVGRSGLQLERNTVASVAKIVALLALSATGTSDGPAIFLAWTIGNAVSLVYLLPRLGAVALDRRPLPPRVRRWLDFDLMRSNARSAASHHALNLMLQAPMLLLSVVVAVQLSATANGYFSTARSVATFVFVLPFSITIALFAAADGRADELVQRMRFTIPFGLAVSVVADLVIWPLGAPVLGIFGHSYSTDAVTVLRVLVLAGLAFVIKDHFVALRRVQGRTGAAAAVATVGALVELAAAVAGGYFGGLLGLSVAWVVALALESLVLGVVLLRAARAGRPRNVVPRPGGKCTDVDDDPDAWDDLDDLLVIDVAAEAVPR